MDRRDQILSRLFTVLQGVPGLAQVVRNRGELQNDARPAIQLLDADERPEDTPFNQARPAFGANRVRLTPEMIITLSTLEPEELGPSLNVLRAALIKAVLLDQQLIDLVGGPSGDIRYDGCITDLGKGRDLVGQMAISITFVYILRPKEL